MRYGQFCPVAKATELLGERWTFLIVRELLMGGHRFSELQRGLGEISPALLDQLADGGRLVGVVREPGAPIGQAVLVRRSGDLFSQLVLFDAGTPVLPGFERPAAFVF